MRSYGQYCSVAKALDVIGARWNLLIVRELLLRGRCRYTDLLHGLPGVATNLLADRLRDLERAGVVTREAAAPPIATTVFGLTPRGRELEAVVRALGEWGVPLMRDGADGDAFRGHWLALPAQLFLTDNEPERPPVAIEMQIGEEITTIEAGDGHVRARPGPAENPELVLSGAPELVIGLLSGSLTLDDALARGLESEGNREALHRVRARRPVAVP